MSNSIFAEHKNICKKNMNVIIHDEGLWDDYRALAQVAYEKKDADYQAWLKSDRGPKALWDGSKVPKHAQRADLEAVNGFEQRFGPSERAIRPNLAHRPYGEEIIRDDLFLMKGDTIVIQVVDYIVDAGQLSSGPIGLSCLGEYGVLYTDRGEK